VADLDAGRQPEPRRRQPAQIADGELGALGGGARTDPAWRAAFAAVPEIAELLA